MAENLNIYTLATTKGSIYSKHTTTYIMASTEPQHRNQETHIHTKSQPKKNHPSFNKIQDIS